MTEIDRHLRDVYTPVDPEVTLRARRIVARHAVDVEDCRELLAALGLLEEA